MAGLANYSIDTTDPLTPVVHVNGQRVSGFQRVSLDCSPGAVPTLYVEYPVGAGFLEGTGIVVQRVDDPEALDVLAEFFDNLDPGELERAMLERDEETTGQAALAVMKEWVKRG